MQIVLWNAYKGKLEVFRADEDRARQLAEAHLASETGVIYFYAEIESITLKENAWI